MNRQVSQSDGFMERFNDLSALRQVDGRVGNGVESGFRSLKAETDRPLVLTRLLVGSIGGMGEPTSSSRRGRSAGCRHIACVGTYAREALA